MLQWTTIGPDTLSVILAAVAGAVLEPLFRRYRKVRANRSDQGWLGVSAGVLLLAWVFHGASAGWPYLATLGFLMLSAGWLGCELRALHHRRSSSTTVEE